MFLSLLTPLLALFGALGYVFVHSTCACCEPVNICMQICGDNYSIRHYCFLSSIVSAIIYVLIHLCVMNGYFIRRDQYIVDKIRKEANWEPYKAFNGENNYTCCNFLPDYFNFFWWVFQISQIVVLVMLWVKDCEIGSNWLFIIFFFILGFVVKIYYLFKYKSFIYKQSK